MMEQKISRNIIFATVLGLCAMAGRADVTNNFPAAANAYVFRGSASSDQDESQTLSTKELNDSNTRIAYVRFKVASFLSNYPVANLTSARLRLYFTGGSADTVTVYGLNDTNLNGVADSVWTANMTWNNQPAKTASPNDIPNSTSGLPNANTTVSLGSHSYGSTAGEVDIPLSIVDLQPFLLADANQQITLLFHNTSATIPGWASISNTSGFLVPTLELAATPSSGPARTLTWDGTVNGNWDTNTTNWKTNPATASTFYNQGDQVTFNDAKTGTSTVTLLLPLSPSTVTVSNSAANYIFGGAGRIRSLTGILKQGPGLLTINTSNDFSGPVIVAGGTLKAGDNNALGVAGGGTIISNGASLDVNAKDLTSEPVTVSGAGVGGNGAIINTGGQQINALRTVTLSGDTTFGGTGRWDIRNSGGAASLNSQGQPRKITKTGSNQFSLVGATVDPALGDIEVRSGIFSVETSTTGLGNPANTLSVSNGATLQFYQNSVIINKPVLLAGTILLPANAASVIFGGAINLAGNATVNLNSGTSLELSNTVSGTGSLTKTGSGTLTLDGSNNYSGALTLSLGKLILDGQLTGGGSLTTSAGTTFAPNGGLAGSAIISGALSPGDLAGIGTFNAGALTLNSGATVTFEIRTNANDLLQVTGNLMLNNNIASIVPLDNLQTNVSYTLVTYTGTRSGTFNSVVNLDTNFTATLDYSVPGRINLVFSRVQTFNIPTTYPTGPGTPNVTPGNDGKLVYSYDPNGDSIPDFSNCGYGGGGVPIPNVPVVTTLSPVVGDNQPQIQAALNALAAQSPDTNGFRGAVLLSAGTYTLNSGIAMSISGVVLRGSGTNNTILSLSNGFSGEAISIGNGSDPAEVAATRHNLIDAYVPVGAKWFRVDSTAGLAVGDTVKIVRPSTQNWINFINMSQYGWTAGSYDMPFDRIITAIEGDRIQIDAPLVQSFDATYGGGYIYKYVWPDRLHQVGVEDFRITSPSHGGQSFGASDLLNGWIRRIFIDRVNGHALSVNGGKWQTFEDIISVRDEPIPHPAAPPSAFAFQSHCQLSLFHRLYSTYGGHDFSSGSRVAGPNVYLECWDQSYSESGPHQRWAVATLFDSVRCGQGLNIRNAKSEGSGHGYQGANCVLWNPESGGMQLDRPPTAHQWGIGPVNSGNRTGTTSEWISPAQHVQPGSLYRAQLAERVGRAQADLALGVPDGDNYFESWATNDVIRVAPGQATNQSFTVNYSPRAGGQAVALTVLPLPPGLAATLGQSNFNGTAATTLNVTAAPSMPSGSYRLSLIGTGAFPAINGTTAALTRTRDFLVRVPGTNLFSLTVTPSVSTIARTATNTYAINVTGTNGFSGSVALSATGLPSGVTAGFNPPTVTGSGVSTLTVTVPDGTAFGYYPLLITGSSGGQNSGAALALDIVASVNLPDPWIDLDIGAQTNKGSGIYGNGVFTGKGGGSDVWNTSDEFNYIFQPQSGDFTITAHVASQTAADAWSKAGVMIRETTNTGSKYVFAMVSPTASHGVSVQYRTTTGGSAADARDVNGPTVPYWVRLVRSGNNFTGFMSGDGATWTQITNAVSITMSSNVMAGLAVCAHSSGALSTATFDNVSIDYPRFTLNISPDTQSVAGSDIASFTVNLGNDFGFNGLVSLSTDGLPPYSTATFNPASISGTNVSTLTIVTTNFTPPGSYNPAITGTNGILSDQKFVSLVVSNSIDSDADGIPDWWTQQAFGHAVGQSGDQSRATDDRDGDGMSNFKEYLCATDPIDIASYLHFMNVTRQGDDELVSWSAVGEISYVVQVSTNLSTGFFDLSPIITPDGDGEITETYTDIGAATNSAPRFYRIRLAP